jgi:intein/homing endonuclease
MKNIDKESEKVDDSININYRTNRSFVPFQYNKEKLKDKGRNKEEIFDKEIIYYSKTESNNDLNKKKKMNNIINMNKDKDKSDYFHSLHKMKI